MISHTHLKASYLPDTTPLIKRPSSWQPSSGCKTAPELAEPRGPPKPHGVPHTGVQKVESSVPGWDWHPGSSASKAHVLQWGKIKEIVHSPAVAKCQGNIFWGYSEIIAFIWPPFLGKAHAWVVRRFFQWYGNLESFLTWLSSDVIPAGDAGICWKGPASSGPQELVSHLRCHFHAIDFATAFMWEQSINNSYLSLTCWLWICLFSFSASWNQTAPILFNTWWKLISYPHSKSIRRTRCSRVLYYMSSLFYNRM